MVTCEKNFEHQNSSDAFFFGIFHSTKMEITQITTLCAVCMTIFLGYACVQCTVYTVHRTVCTRTVSTVCIGMSVALVSVSCVCIECIARVHRTYVLSFAAVVAITPYSSLPPIILHTP